MFGNLVLAIVTGTGAAIGMYIAYGTAALRSQAGGNRVRNSVLVGVAAGAMAFLLRVLVLA